MDNSFQTAIFERIFKQFHRRSDAVNAIAETLDTSRDSVYRRVRGSTFLTPDEIKSLTLRFKISLDSLIYTNHNIVLFQYRPMLKPIKDFDEYLKSILKDLDRVHRVSNRKLYYASSDFPIFFYFLIPELTSMKMYIWGRMMWDFNYLERYPFHFDLVPQTTHVLAKELIRLYMKIPSVDLWGLNILENTLNQIEYMFNIGAFRDNEDALVLLDKLIELIHLLKMMAETGRKGINLAGIQASDTPFELYLNDIVFTNNTVLADSDEGKVVYASFDNPNFLKSLDQVFGENTKKWFHKLIAQSSSISVNTDRRRRWYFNMLESKIKSLKKRLELMISDNTMPSSF
jgi:hypothetical protein